MEGSVKHTGAMELNYSIRPMEPRDVDALVALEAASFSLPWNKQHFEELFQRDYCYYLVAVARSVVQTTETDGKVEKVNARIEETGERIIGFAGFTNICNEANIDNVVVDENYRGQGIAKGLVQALIAAGESQGVEAFTLEVRVSNAPAIRVYESVGFVSEGIRPKFYEKPVEDAMIMWRR